MEESITQTPDSYLRLIEFLNVFKPRDNYHPVGFDADTATKALSYIHSGMTALCMKERERGSITSTLKANTLKGRWWNMDMAVNNPARLGPGSLPATPATEWSFERDMVLRMPLRKNSADEYYFRVMAVYTKYNNKYYVDKDAKVAVKKRDNTKEEDGDSKKMVSKTYLSVAMIELDDLYGVKHVMPNTAFSHTDVYKKVDAYKSRFQVVAKLSNGIDE